ncbi:hypothetical protein DY000_02026910 [Brassica cretica]|uniref:RNase H type-1 domain-containing protein n=1 Tax=Brassica cretica TaxID=69181 RepID=A0ABQ7E986_BRACR|nr:hypothetical protein DY000_02026910 [Brassica cretica]
MLVNAIIRPREWPSFKFKVMEIRLLLRNFLAWRVLCESFEANRGARLIATSAVQDFRFQSYVATVSCGGSTEDCKSWLYLASIAMGRSQIDFLIDCLGG